MFNCFAKIAVVTLFLWLTKDKGCAGIKIISSPQQLYVLDGHQGTVRCQNRSDSGEHFYSYITDAVWYRYYDNGSNFTISAGSGTVYSRGYTLIFNPLLGEDQGHYFCCTQSVQCSEAFTTATISIPPIIRANSSNYTAKVGSEITLTCSIINQGVPIARFRWIRDGIEQLRDNVVTNVSLGLFTMTLANLTMNDGGTYTCMATSIRSSRSDHIVLNVSEKVEANISNTDYNVATRRVVQLSVTFAVPPCRTAMTSLSEVLSNFVQTQYDHSVIVTVNQTECINRTTALFELTITSPVANHTLHHLLYDMNINAIGLDIGIGVIKVCEQNCTEPTVASGPSDNDDGDDEQMFIKLIFIVLVVVVALVLMLIIILCMIIYKRHAHNTDNSVVVMHEIDATRNVMGNEADGQ
ncbi:transmembrane and immunoglobulin domain-containing protein 1-like [Dysidea avara]|uniref:transmembrane and immunoglobulin domain-containing protein 1-like n=1 Tax=Dysidea avara TaxID=196820 RepID=UPI00331D7A28